MRFLIPLTLAAAAGVGLVAIPDVSNLAPVGSPQAQVGQEPSSPVGSGQGEKRGSQLTLRLPDSAVEPVQEVAAAGPDVPSSGPKDSTPIQRLLEKSRQTLDRVLGKSVRDSSSPSPGVNRYGKQHRRTSRRRRAGQAKAPAAPQADRSARSSSTRETASAASPGRQVSREKVPDVVQGDTSARREQEAALHAASASADQEPVAHGEVYRQTAPGSRREPVQAAMRSEPLGKQELQQIVEQLTRRIRQQPADAALYAMRGKAYAQLGEFARALQDLELAIALDPRLAEAYGNRGLILRRQGKLKQALADFDTVVRLQPQLAKGYLDRAKTYYELGAMRKVLRDASLALQRDEQLAEARRLRAAALLRLGRPSLAAEEARRGLQLAPWDARLRRLLALAEAAAGNYDQALAVQLRQGDDSLQAHWLLGTWSGVELPQQIALLNKPHLLEEQHEPAADAHLAINPEPTSQVRVQPRPETASTSSQSSAVRLRLEAGAARSAVSEQASSHNSELPRIKRAPAESVTGSGVIRNPFIASSGQEKAPSEKPVAASANAPLQAQGNEAQKPLRLRANEPEQVPAERIRLVIHDGPPSPVAGIRATKSANGTLENRPRITSPAVRSSRRRSVGRTDTATANAAGRQLSPAEEPKPLRPVARLHLSASASDSGKGPAKAAKGQEPAVAPKRPGQSAEVQVQVRSVPETSPVPGTDSEPASPVRLAIAPSEKPGQVPPSEGNPGNVTSSRRRKPQPSKRIAAQQPGRKTPDEGHKHVEMVTRSQTAKSQALRQGTPGGVPRIVAAVAAEEAEFRLPVSERVDLAPPLRLTLPKKLPALKEATSQALVERAWRQFQQGDLESALAMYDVIVRLEPQSALARAYRGLIHWRLGHPQQALADARWAEKQNPRLALAPAVHALALQSQGETEAAWEASRRAQRLAPECSPLALQAAAVALRLKQPQEALKRLQPLLRSSVRDPWALLYASMAWAQQQQYNRAMTAVQQALKLWPKWTQALKQRAAVAMRQHQLQQAIDDWTAVLQAQPDNLPVRLQRAEAYLQAQRWSKAIEDLSAVLERDAENRRARRLRAEAYYRLKAYSEAVKDCRRLLAGKEQRAEDRLLLAKVLLALNHADEALEELTRAESQGLRSAELYFLRARALEAQGELEAALADYSEALRRDPTHVQAGLNQVRLLVELGRAGEAVEQCRRLLQQQAQPTQVRLWLAEALLENNQAGEAIDHLQQVLQHAEQKEQRAKALQLLAVAYARTGQRERSRKAFRQALALVPDSAEVYLHRGLLALEAGQTEQALDDLQTACRLAPEDPRCRLARALALERKGLYSQALADLNWLLRHRRMLKARLVRARIYVAQGAHQLALEDLNQALEQEPELGEAYRLRAALHLKLNRNAEALEDAKKALQYEPEDAELLTILGEALRREGKLKQAIEVLDQAIERDAELAPAWISRGMTRLNQGQAQAALKDLNRAVELMPKNPRAYLQRGIIHAHLGNHQQAARDFDQAIELAPTDAKAYAYRAMAALKLGQYQDAVDFYTEALQLHPRYALAYYERGKAHWLLGHEDEALADYQRAVELNPIYAGAFYDEP